MPKHSISDPMLRQTSWIPNRTHDFMQGEKRGEGQVIPIKGWVWKSDRRKLKLLRELAQRYGGDPHLRWFTVNQILKPAGVQQRDYKGQAAALLKWVQQNIYYTNEPDEQVQTPWRTIKVRTGDCDDSSLLLASFAESIRMPWKFTLAGHYPNGKKAKYIEGQRYPSSAQFSHIYVTLGWPPFKPTEWAAAEPTIRGAPLGHDVVENGMRPFGEEVVSRSLGAPQMGGLVDVAAQHIEGQLTDSHNVPTWVKTLPWQGIITGVIQGVITTLIVNAAIKYGERKGKK
jgi:hypothetical protein